MPRLLCRIRINMDRLRARLGNAEGPAAARVAVLYLDHLGFRCEEDGRWVGRQQIVTLFRDGEVIDQETLKE